MRFLSICSGIEAASVAFHPLGWQALAFAEIEPFPCSLLAHHYPGVPNLGDLTRWREWSPDLLAQVDTLCGGTPCQAFSVAGLRGSLSDERGNLTLTFCHLFDEIDHQRHLCGRPPAVCLWENVPGVLNTDDNAFGHFLAGLAGEDEPLTPPGTRWTDAGYVRGPRRAIAWRVLDAQYFGLAQRRERVFVVASADPAFDPAAVLFELDGLRRDTPPRRGAGEGAAPTLSARTKGGGGLGTDAECDGAVIPERVAGVPEVANCLTRRMHKGLNTTLDEGQTPVVEVTHALRAEGFDASEDGTGRGTPIVPVALTGHSHYTQDGLPSLRKEHGDAGGGSEALIAFTSKDHGADASVDLAPTLRAGNHADSHANGGNPPAIAFPEYLSGTACPRTPDLSPALGAVNPTAVAFQPRIARNGRGDMGDLVNALNAHSGTTGKGDAAPCVAYAIQERAVCENPNAGPDGVGVRSDDCAYTLEARQVPQAVAQPPTAYTLHGTIREGTGSAIQNSSNTVVNTLQAQGLDVIFCHASTPETYTGKVLSFLRDQIGKEAFAEWGFGILDSLQPQEILQSHLLWESCGCQSSGRQIMGDGALSCPKTITDWAMRGLRSSECQRCSPPRSQSAKQCTGKPPEDMPEMSHQIASPKEILQGLWEASQGLDVVRQALSEIQKIWRSMADQNQSAHASWKVRRLTCEECEILMGFPIGYTLIPGKHRPRKGDDHRDTMDYLMALGFGPEDAALLAHGPDGPRYKALGNSWAVPVARWIARRIDACAKALSRQ